MTIYTESMTKLYLHDLTIRAWRQETEPESTETNYSKEVADLLVEKYESIPEESPVSFSDIAKIFLEIERMNAIEIVNSQGDGVVVYKDWP
jgi:hypothetical protein